MKKKLQNKQSINQKNSRTFILTLNSIHMKKILLALVALCSLIGASAQVPVNSTTNGSDVWYYIKGQRGETPTAVYATAKADNSQVLDENLAFTDAQKWKVVTNGTGIALVNKAYNTYINADVENYLAINTVSTMPTVALKFTASASLDDAVIIENIGATGGVDDATVTFRMHTGGLNDAWGLVNYADDITDNVSFLFVPAALSPSKTQLSLTINDATTLKNACVVGTAAGQYPQTAKDDLIAAIATAQTVYDNMTATTEQDEAANTALLSAINTFKASVVFPFELSTASAPKWYYIQGADVVPNTLYCYNKAITLNSKYDLTWATVAVTAGQLFRFEQISGTATFRIINQLIPSGEMLSINSPILYGTPTNTAWSFEKLTGANGDQYRIASNGKILHLQSTGSDLVSWDAGYNSASALKFTSVTNETALQAIANSLTMVITEAQAVLNAGATGTNPGQYSTETKATFQNAINAATTVKNNASATAAEQSTAIESLINAQAAFIATSLPKVSTEGNDTWYYIKAERGVAAPFYFTAKSDNSTIKCEALTSTDYQLWKIVPNGSGYALQNKANNYYLNYDATPFGTKAAMPTKSFNIYASTYLATAFHIYGSSYTVHAGGSGLQNYSVLSDNASFYFVEYNVALALADGITAAEAVYTNNPAGTNPGQYLAENKTIYQTAIDAAKAVRDQQPAATKAELTAAITALATAKATFLSSTTNPIKYGTVWYAIKNPSRGTYLKDSGAAATITGAAFAGNDDSFLWKIVNLGSGNVSIISKLNSGHITVPAANSAVIALTSTAQTWSLALLGQAQYNINGSNAGARQLHMASNNTLVAYPGGLGSASVWSFEEISNVVTEVSNPNSTINVTVINRMLVITGTDATAKAFSLTGTQVDATKPLTPGIYIIKLDAETFKVSVK